MFNRKFLFATFRYWLVKFAKYRANTLFSFFGELAVPICINVMFLIGLNDSNAEFLEIKYVLEYIVLANIVFTISITGIEEVISADIKSATLIYKLTEPTSPCVSYILYDIANKSIRILMFYFPTIIILAALGWITINGNLAIAFVFLILANIIGYSLSFIIGSLSFWITETWGISSVKNLLFAVAAGAVFPFSILPEILRTIILCTPFPYLGYVPSEILLNAPSDNIVKMLFIAVIWCVILVCIAVVVWKCGKKKYESVGV